MSQKISILQTDHLRGNRIGASSYSNTVRKSGLPQVHDKLGTGSSKYFCTFSKEGLIKKLLYSKLPNTELLHKFLFFYRLLQKKVLNKCTCFKGLIIMTTVNIYMSSTYDLPSLVLSPLSLPILMR